MYKYIDNYVTPYLINSTRTVCGDFHLKGFHIPSVGIRVDRSILIFSFASFTGQEAGTVSEGIPRTVITERVFILAIINIG